jgi:uncharacterized membrane protein
MNVALAVLLIINAVYNFVTWPQFLKRVMKDPRARTTEGKATPFLTVHIVLVTIALVIGVVSLIAAILSLSGLW